MIPSLRQAKKIPETETPVRSYSCASGVERKVRGVRRTYGTSGRLTTKNDGKGVKTGVKNECWRCRRLTKSFSALIILYVEKKTRVTHRIAKVTAFLQFFGGKTGFLGVIRIRSPFCVF